MVKFNLKKHNFLKTYESINFNLTSVEVQGVGRRLRTTWSPQLAQDMDAFHSIDMENELAALLSENISQEINREILNGLMDSQNILVNETNDRHIHGRGSEPHTFTPQQILQPHRFTHLPRRVDRGFENVAFPLVRRVFAQTLGNDLVAVQPLSAPTGQLMYLDFNNNINAPIIEPTVLPNGSWYIGNMFDSHIGVRMTLKPHIFIKKPRWNVIDTASDMYLTR